MGANLESMKLTDTIARSADRKCQFFPLFFFGVVWEVREEKVVKVARMVKVVRVGLEVRLVRVGRVASLDAMLLELGCGQKDPQRGEGGNPQFHIF